MRHCLASMQKIERQANEVQDTVRVSPCAYDHICYVLLFPDGASESHPKCKINEIPGAKRNKMAFIMFKS